jgi:hypothetical protein
MNTQVAVLKTGAVVGRRSQRVGTRTRQLPGAAAHPAADLPDHLGSFPDNSLGQRTGAKGNQYLYGGRHQMGNVERWTRRQGPNDGE